MELKNSKTEQNLKTAFAGESQASLKYQFFAAKAKEEGYEKIANIFLEFSNQEKAHAKVWFKTFNNGINSTAENLKEASAGENFEWTKMYMEFASIAKEEGFDEIAEKFEKVGLIEKNHEAKYNKVANCLKSDKIFNNESECYWVCRNCGHVHFGLTAPKECDVCGHPRAFFQRELGCH